MRQRLPIDSLSLEQYALARCVIQRSQMLQRTRCPVLAHRVISLRLIGRYGGVADLQQAVLSKMLAA